MSNEMVPPNGMFLLYSGKSQTVYLSEFAIPSVEVRPRLNLVQRAGLKDAPKVYSLGVGWQITVRSAPLNDGVMAIDSDDTDGWIVLVMSDLPNSHHVIAFETIMEARAPGVPTRSPNNDLVIADLVFTQRRGGKAYHGALGAAPSLPTGDWASSLYIDIPKTPDADEPVYWNDNDPVFATPAAGSGTDGFLIGLNPQAVN